MTTTTTIPRYTFIDSPFGSVLIVGNERGAITHIRFHDRERDIEPQGDWTRDDDRLSDARTQLTSYFAGELKKFTLDLAPDGTEFQHKCWKELCRIPYGETTTYGALAKKIGNPKASRAVGLANNRNRIPIVIPCHRVIGSDGSLTGYAGGLDLKRGLLDLESGLFGRA